MKFLNHVMSLHVVRSDLKFRRVEAEFLENIEAKSWKEKRWENAEASMRGTLLQEAVKGWSEMV